MNKEALFLFLILLLGLLLCSFLGGNCGSEGFTGNFSGTFTTTKPSSSSTKPSSSATNPSSNYDNYNHFSGSSSKLSNGSTFYGPNGGSVVVNINSDGTQSLKVILSSGQQPITFTTKAASAAPTTKPTTKPTSNNIFSNFANDITKEFFTNNSVAGKTTFYGPNGGTASIVTTNGGHQAIDIETNSGSYVFTQTGNTQTGNNQNNHLTSTQYYGSTGYPIQQSSSALAYTGNSPSSSPSSVTSASTKGYGSEYYSTMPPGIPASQIPPGQEDLYILKSEIVPPVCPACPVAPASCSREKKCPPCPACARCPEPSFECKKVPNYNAINNDSLPQPVLNDFSQFGM
jgi:hypothetical protein